MIRFLIPPVIPHGRAEKAGADDDADHDRQRISKPFDLRDDRPRLNIEDFRKMENARQRRRVLPALETCEIRGMHVGFASELKKVPALRRAQTSNDRTKAHRVSIHACSSCHLDHLARKRMSMASMHEAHAANTVSMASTHGRSSPARVSMDTMHRRFAPIHVSMAFMNTRPSRIQVSMASTLRRFARAQMSMDSTSARSARIFVSTASARERATLTRVAMGCSRGRF